MSRVRVFARRFETKITLPHLCLSAGRREVERPVPHECVDTRLFCLVCLLLFPAPRAVFLDEIDGVRMTLEPLRPSCLSVSRSGILPPLP